MRGPYYRRARRLVGFWRGGSFFLHPFMRRPAVPVPPAIVELLAELDGWTSMPGFAAAAGLGSAAARHVLERLHAVGLLERRWRPRASVATVWDSWEEAAAFLHFSTRDHPFETTAQTRRRLIAQARPAPPPAPTKEYAGRPRVPLPRPRLNGDFETIVRQRRTWRRFGAEKPTVNDLAAVLGLTFAVQRWVDLGAAGRVMLRTSPSGGARHPTEAYVLVRGIRGVAAGFYHYAPAEHALVPLRTRRVSGREVTALLAGQSWYGHAHAVVFLATVFERTAWKYRTARAYKSVLIEAGHFAQTFCLAATARRLAPFCTAAFSARRVERALGLEAERESVNYVVGFGSRPPGVRWAPWPELEVSPDG